MTGAYRLTCVAVALVGLLGFAAITEAGPVLYSVRSNANDNLYSIDAATGVATSLGQVGLNDAEGLAFVGNSLFAIGGTVEEFWNITTPPGALVGATGPRDGIDAGLDYDTTTGTMYNMNSSPGSGNLYTVNVGTGAATLVGSSSVFTDGLAIDGSGNAFGIDGAFSDSLYSINLASGAATAIGGLGLGNISVQFGLTFAGDTLYGLSSAGDLYTLNTTTGVATYIATTDCGEGDCGGWEGLAAQSVPEPATLLLLGVGLLGFAARRRS